jgi:hypothetical protein
MQLLFSARLLSLTYVLAFLISSTHSWPIWWPPWKGKGGHHGPGSDPDQDFDFQERNFNTISRIYNLTVFPNQLPIIQRGGAGVPPGLFNKDVVGRVDPVGDFEGFEHSIEYFFALAPLPQGNGASSAITSYKITEFSSACANVAASVVYLFCSVVNPGSPNHGKPLPPLKQVSPQVCLLLLALSDLLSRWHFGGLTTRGRSSSTTRGSPTSTTGWRARKRLPSPTPSSRLKASKSSAPLRRCDAPAPTPSGRASASAWLPCRRSPTGITMRPGATTSFAGAFTWS